MQRGGVRRWRRWEGSWRVEWKGLDLGYVHLRDDGRYQWMSVRAIRSGWGDTLDEATDGLLLAELDADELVETELEEPWEKRAAY